ncbi:SUMF1/EgtB/PvdO family nonheme iron enzyme [Desulfococcaceae bacterium HSG9]|nr:SUMF1/EgtB/PvdO family nonheme iron enzyme [Desulfococcaceae bacterium HSG9]
MDNFPLNSFLVSLATDGIRLSVYDYDQLIVIFQTGGIRAVSRLKHVLTALLAKNEEQQEIILRRFDNFFKLEIDADNKDLAIDIRQIIDDLKAIAPDPDPVPKPPKPLPTPDKTEPVCHQKPYKKYIPWVLACLILVAAFIGVYFNFIAKKPAPKPIVPEAPVLEVNPPVEEKAAPPIIRKRLYPDVPYIKSIIQTPLIRSAVWMKYAVISAIIFIIAIIYAIYLFRLKKGPKDREPEYDKDAPGYFNLGTIGAKPLPRLDDETLAFLADSMGYFQSRQPGRMLNVPASIKATLKQGGIPACTFYRRQQIRTLLILEDVYAEALDWNTIAAELANGMIRCGVPVLYGKFRGSPETFKTPDGSVYHLDDLEDHRRGILMLIFTDGKSFQRGQNIFALESISRWPMVAWMELRAKKFLDESVSLPIRNKIPLCPATKDGILQAIRRFLTEQGTREQGTDASIQDNRLPDLADTTLDVWAAHLLGDALPWAQDCAMIQPITPGLADELRMRFHPHLAPEQIECLYALPNTTQTDSGLRFSDDVLKVLREGFLTCRTDDEPKDVLKFILNRVEKAEPDEPKDSLAYLSWEAVRERVRLELGQGDGRRFGELMHSPLGKTLGDSLSNHGFPDEQEKIPIRKPKNRAALQRLAKVEDNPLEIGNFVKSWQRACLGVLILCFLASFGWMIKCKQDASGPIPNLEITGLEKTPARLEIWENDTWKVEQESDEVGAFAKKPLLDNRKYRMTLYGNGYRSVKEFDTGIDQKTVLGLALQDVERNCVDKYPDIGLTVVCCPEGGAEQDQKALKIATWKERLGDKSPTGRMMSVGLEFSEKDVTTSELSNFRNALLKTGSVDVLYRVHPDQNGDGQPEQALSQFRGDLTPWLTDSQLIWWYVEEFVGKDDTELAKALKAVIKANKVIDVAALSLKYKELARGLNLELKWISTIEKLLEPGNDIVVSEREILLALGKGPTVRLLTLGKEEPIVLVRPLTGSAQYALTVKTTPKNATISIKNSKVTYQDGILLPPGRYDIEVSSEEYKAYREWITLEKKDIAIEVRLVKIRTETFQPITNSLKMKFVYIPPGKFMMGSPESEKGRDNEKKQHEVTLSKGFYMGTTEVTQAQWKAVMGNNPSRFKKCGDNCPVESVSWNDVQDFIKKLNQKEKTDKYRLPTEAEWEYAARAGSQTAFANGEITEIKCGQDPNLVKMGWYCGNSGDKTHSVGEKSPNVWGLHDMHGNVYEWCQDWFGNYSSSPVADPKGPSTGSNRVCRGGCWMGTATGCRSANRWSREPVSRLSFLGFRLLRMP